MTVISPIVVDLGRTGDEQIGELRRGAGQLVDDVEEVMRLVRFNADAENGNRVFLAVVAIYTRAEEPQGA